MDVRKGVTTARAQGEFHLWVHVVKLITRGHTAQCSRCGRTASQEAILQLEKPKTPALPSKVLKTPEGAR